MGVSQKQLDGAIFATKYLNTQKAFADYDCKVCESSSIETEEESKRIKESLKYLWEMK